MTPVEIAHEGTDSAAPAVSGMVERLRAIAIRGLRVMYRPEAKAFAFRLDRVGDGTKLAGVSARYTAIALIGLAGETAVTVSEVLAGGDLDDVCGQLIEQRIVVSEELGEVSLALWCARRLNHPAAQIALERLQALRPDVAVCATVELSWALSALSTPGELASDRALSQRIAERLMSSYNSRSSLFPHWPLGVRAPRFRWHVTCFADLVYPIQALSHYHRKTGDQRAIEMARTCASQMCELQGSHGQWWWHYDVRTGRVIEKYPVYAVHQDAMAPMALHALREAGGDDPSFTSAIEKGLDWLQHSPELDDSSLIDEPAGVIWRKVARREPGKLSRQLQAAASRISSGLRVPGIGAALRPGRIDAESRPYHMGWILHAWPPNQFA